MSAEGLSPEELQAESATALPDKEVVSILDLNADLDLAIDAAAPIDLAVAANANVAAPINAAAGANILSVGSDAQALGDQGVMINQGIDADATANAGQDSTIDQGNDTLDDGSTDGTTQPAADTSTTTNTGEGALDGGPLLNVDVNLDADADIAAPIDVADDARKGLPANLAEVLDAAIGALEPLADWTAENIQAALKQALVEDMGIKPRLAFGPVRTAVSGRRVSPPLFESMVILGQESSLRRLRAFRG